MHKYDAATKEFAEAKELNIKMAEIEPDAFYPSLATVLEYEGEMLFEMKNFEQALVNFNSASKIREDQFSKNPGYLSFVTDAKNWINRIKRELLV